MKVSVVIPCYNEETTILNIVDRVFSSGCEIFEIVIVDDCSSDSSGAVLSRISSEKKKIRVFRNERNRGKGYSVNRGIKESLGDVVVIQDADLEYDPREYERLIDPIKMGLADVVYGSRFQGGGAHRVVYYWHMLGNRFLTTLSNMFTNLNLTDMETCYKVFRRECFEGICIQESRFGFEPEITAKFAKKRLRFYEVGISYYGRSYEEGKKIGWKDGFSAIRSIIKYNIFG